MASCNPTRTRSRRLTAQQAAAALQQWNSSDENNSEESDSDETTSNSDDYSEDESNNDDDVNRFCRQSNRRSHADSMIWNEISTNRDQFRLSVPFEPTRTPGPTNTLSAESTALECLQELLTDDVIDEMIRMINDYAQHKISVNNPPRRRSVYSNWRPISQPEFYKFLAVLIAMGLDKRPALKDYWSTYPSYYTPWFGQIFPRDRFLAIYHTMLHASAVEAESKEKNEPFLNKLTQKFQAAFYPYENVSIDEMVIGWKGKWKYKQYNPAKPKKYHIKTFGLCDSITGYVYNILIYFGKETSYDPNFDASTGQAQKVFEFLLRPLGQGHHVFADRYYTTFELIKYLTDHKTYYTGTLMPNRRNFPADLKSLKLDPSEQENLKYSV